MAKAQTKASNKYNAKAYDRIAIQVKKGDRDRYKALAARLGVSVNQLFIQAVERYIEDNIDALSEPISPDRSAEINTTED